MNPDAGPFQEGPYIILLAILVVIWSLRGGIKIHKLLADVEEQKLRRIFLARLRFESQEERKRIERVLMRLLKMQMPENNDRLRKGVWRFTFYCLSSRKSRVVTMRLTELEFYVPISREKIQLPVWTPHPITTTPKVYSLIEKKGRFLGWEWEQGAGEDPKVYLTVLAYQISEIKVESITGEWIGEWIAPYPQEKIKIK